LEGIKRAEVLPFQFAERIRPQAEGKAPKPDDTNLGHCRADHPERLDRDRAVRIDEVRAATLSAGHGF
jgi:hypothetical protein